MTARGAPPMPAHPVPRSRAIAPAPLPPPFASGFPKRLLSARATCPFQKRAAHFSWKRVVSLITQPAPFLFRVIAEYVRACAPASGRQAPIRKPVKNPRKPIDGAALPKA